MGDDLAAFFAKKKDKKKKKTGVINIDDIRERLERKAKRNEMEEVEDEEDGLIKLTSKTTAQQMDGNNDGEDSEWVDFTNKTAPTLAELKIREYTEQDDEYEDESRITKEPTKTWNSTNGIGVNTEAVKDKVTVNSNGGIYRLKHQRERAEANNLNSEMAFPSLANANEMEKHIKKEEEERKREEQARKKIEEERRIQDERRREKYQVPRPQATTMSSASDRMRTPRPIQEEKAENDDDWRKKATVTPMSPQRTIGTGSSVRTGGIEPQATSHTEQDSWRKPLASPKASPAHAIVNAGGATERKPGTDKYIPPALRK